MKSVILMKTVYRVKKTVESANCTSMFMKFRIIIGLSLFLAASHTLAAEPASADECKLKINNELAYEQRFYRYVLFGVPKAQDANIGSVYYDTERNPWYKVSKEAWRTVAPGYESTEWGNSQMDSQSEIPDPEDRGIFTTKRLLTSELIPYLISNMRAYQCSLKNLCELVSVSLTKTEDNPVEVDIETPGCILYEGIETFSECHLHNEDAEAEPSHENIADLLGYCNSVASLMLKREAELLKTVVEYDAAYRSLLQFAGSFDVFLEELRWTFTGTLREGARLIGSLGRIPCFIGSCDEPPALCGDGECSEDFESCNSCEEDCGSCCGDDSCNFGETCSTCEEDCGVCCPNGECGPGETCDSCEADCGVCPAP